MADAETRPPPDEIILYEKNPKTKIATITINRPDKHNAMTIAARHRFAVDPSSGHDARGAHRLVVNSCALRA